MSRLFSECVVFVAVYRQDQRVDNGSGFVIRHAIESDLNYTYVVTCRHVVGLALGPLAQGISVKVNEIKSEIVFEDLALDLCILRVPSKIAAPIRPHPFQESRHIGMGQFAGSLMAYGYSIFRKDEGSFFYNAAEVEKFENLTIYSSIAQKHISYLRFTLKVDNKLDHGNSGGPLVYFPPGGQEKPYAIGVLRLSDQREGIGYALDIKEITGITANFSSELIKNIAIPDEGVRESTSVRSGPKKSGKESETRPNELGPPKNLSPLGPEDDPQKGRWGGKRIANGISSRIEVHDYSRSAFWFDVIVEAIDGAQLEAPAYFYLHHEYPRSVIKISRLRESNRKLILEDVSAYGTYTIGIFARKKGDSDWTMLELDLEKYGDGIPKNLIGK